MLLLSLRQYIIIILILTCYQYNGFYFMNRKYILSIYNINICAMYYIPKILKLNIIFNF